MTMEKAIELIERRLDGKGMTTIQNNDAELNAIPDIGKILGGMDIRNELLKKGIIISSTVDPNTNKIMSEITIMNPSNKIKKKSPPSIVVDEKKEPPKPEIKGGDDIPFVRTPEYELLLKVIENKKGSKMPVNILLVGPHGCGKTESAKMVAKELNRTLECCSGVRDASYKMLIEDIGFDGVKTYEQDGFMLRAMKGGLDADGKEIGEGSILLVDELFAIPSEVLVGFNTVLADPHPRRKFTRKSGKVVESHSNFVFIGTSNTFGRGSEDNMDLYSAQTEIKDASLLDRFDLVIPCDYNLEAEKRILETSLISADVEMLTKFTQFTRDMAERGELQTPVSTRNLKSVVKLYQRIGDLSLSVFHGIFARFKGSKEILLRYDEAYQRVTGVKLLDQIGIKFI